VLVHEAAHERGHVKAVRAVFLERLPFRAREGPLERLAIFEPDLDAPVVGHAGFGVLWVDRPDEMVLHVALHPQVFQRERAVVVEPPATHLLRVEIGPKLEQEDDLEHCTPFATVGRRGRLPARHIGRNIG
jgi:hypothetical protein